MPESQPEVLLEADVVERIRTIFLQPRPHVSIAAGSRCSRRTRGNVGGSPEREDRGRTHCVDHLDLARNPAGPLSPAEAGLDE